MTSRFLPFAIASLATIGLAVALALLLRVSTSGLWWDMPTAKAGLTDEYCELNRMEAAVRQPVNSWSNLAYFFLGTWALVVGISDRWRRSNNNPLQRFPAMTMWMGVALIGLCFGSFFFHASLTRPGQHWDMTFTYAVAIGLIVAAAYRWALVISPTESKGRRFGWIMVANAGGVAMYFLKWHIDGKLMLPLLMLVGVALAIALYFKLKGKFSGKYLTAALLALVLAAVCRSLDLAKIGCDPEGWFQLHAFWHLFTGLSAFLFWRVLHSENA